MELQALRKEISHFPFICEEYPGLMLKFIPGGTLLIKGQALSPIKYEWSIRHNGNDCILSVSPHLIHSHGDYKVDMVKDHINLTSIKAEDVNLHLVRLKLKAI